jgi:uncharacterized membrane protein YhhN
MSYAAWSLFALAALADWVAVALGSQRLEAIFKPAALALLLLVAVVLGAGDSTEGAWLLVALSFGLLGDIFLLSDSVPRFKAGLAAFLVGHLAYVAAFTTHEAWPTFSGVWGGVFTCALVLAAAVAFTQRVVPNVWRTEGPALALPVAAYTVVIAAMLVTAFGTGLGLVALGGTIFVASDSILARDRFVAPLPRGHLMVMVTYHVGQALIVAGLLGSVG